MSIQDSDNVCIPLMVPLMVELVGGSVGQAIAFAINKEQGYYLIAPQVQGASAGPPEMLPESQIASCYVGEWNGK